METDRLRPVHEPVCQWSVSRPKSVTARIAWGLHIHEPLDLAPIWSLAQAGRLAGVTVINNLSLANALVDYVPYVVYRVCLSDHDNPVQNYQEYQADPRVIYQFGNEANVDHDVNHWLALMQEADAHGRKIVIFSDPVGTPEDDKWIEREPALRYAKSHGHFCGLHAYGIVTDGGSIYHPMTEPSGWRWFAGRYQHLYSLMPPEAQPDLLLNECGAGGFQLNGTAEQWLADVCAMNEIAQTTPYLKAFMWWDFSRIGLGFDRDLINDYVHLLL